MGRRAADKECIICTGHFVRTQRCPLPAHVCVHVGLRSQAALRVFVLGDREGNSPGLYVGSVSSQSHVYAQHAASN